MYKNNVEGLSKALHTRLVATDEKKKTDEEPRPSRPKHVIHVNVIILNNSCDKSLCQLVNDVLSRKEIQISQNRKVSA